ncbi:MAG: hypothetical protein JWO74_171 [Solirubrobacterales bacterium]|nr:hypothetical protein [Solirubrobacterales bacterium]
MSRPRLFPPGASRVLLRALAAALLTMTVAYTGSAVLVPGVLASSEPVHAHLTTHRAVLDRNGRILSWYAPRQTRGYDHVIRLAWNFIESKVPLDSRWGTGLPVHLVSSVYDGTTKQGSYWQHNPASLYAQFVDSLVTWHGYSGDTKAVAAVKQMLDYQLAHGTTPAGWEWPSVPFATACAGDKDYGRCLAGMPRSFYGGIETDKVGELGVGYAQFYELTGDRRYLDAAVAAADALARHVRPGDADHTPWPFRVDARTGNVLAGKEYGGMIIAPVRLFDELIRIGEGDVGSYTRARDVAWSWLLNNPLNPRSRAYRKWSGYFEDVNGDTQNLNQASPTMTAYYLLTQSNPGAVDPQWRAHTKDLLEWVRSYFGRGPYMGAWAIDEQHAPGRGGCCSDAGLGSDTSRWGAVNALYAARTGDKGARERAYRALNYATYFTDDDGRVACCGDDFDNPYWFDDGYADYARNFSWAMGALPDLAPRGQDHLLASTSVVQQVAYAKRGVTYRTFHGDGTETLRLTFRPTTVTADGRPLQRRARLDQAGYTVTPLRGGDVVVRVRRDAARDVAISGS